MGWWSSAIGGALVCVLACGARSSPSVPDASTLDVVVSADLGVAPRPASCLEDELVAPGRVPPLPVGLTVHDPEGCGEWAEPWRAWPFSEPPAAPPVTLWQTSVADGLLLHAAAASVDGSVWVIETHLETERVAGHSTIAVYERGGRLRWRSDPFCDARVARLVVGADGVGTALLWWTPERGFEEGATVVRIGARRGELREHWQLPDGRVSFSGQSARLVFFSLAAGGVTASCHGARPLWTRFRPAMSEWMIFASADRDDHSWLHGATNPTELDGHGAILRTLERPEPRASETQYVSSAVSAGWPSDGVFVNERLRSLLDRATTYRHFGVLYEDGVRREVVNELPSPTELTFRGLRPAPDRSVWDTRQGRSLGRFVDGELVWRLDLPLKRLHGFSVDGSALVSALDAERRVSFLARVRSDGTFAWRHDLIREDGETEDHAGANTKVTLTPDGRVYAVSAQQLLVVQTDFAPVRPSVSER